MGYKDYLPKNYQANVVPGISSATINKVQELKTKEKNKTKYGVEVPTVESITNQASMIKEHGTDAEVSNYLGGAISDGVISANDANGIFMKVTGSKNNLYSPENIKNVNAAIANAMGVPKANPAVQNPYDKKYGELNHEDTVKAYNDLYAKYAETGDVGLVEELEYLKGRSEETASEDVLKWKRDKAETKANEAFKDYEGYMFTHNSLHNPDEDSVSASKAKAKFNAYKSFASESDRYGDLYDEAKTKRIIAEYEEPAMADPDFDSKKIYSGKAKSNIELYINGGSVYDTEEHPDEGTAMVESEFESYRYVTPKERDVYNYYVNTNQPEKAYDFATKLLPTLNKRAAMDAQKEFAEFAKEYPITANAFSVANNVATAPSAGVEFISQMFTGEDFDPYAPGFRGAIASEAIRGQTAENIKNPVWKFIYNTGMSMADSAAVMPFGGAGIVFLGTNAAVAEGRKTALEGGSKSDILVKGITAGAFEAIFEKVGIDNLFKPKAVGGLKEAIKTVLKQGGIEASEEFCTSIANIVVDNVKSKGESQYAQLIRQYTDEGYSLAEAESKAIIDMVGEVGMETLSGFVSGVLFGGAGATMNYAQATNTGKAVNAQGNENALIDYAKMQDSNSKAYKDAVKLSKKDNVKNAEVGALLQQMIIDKQITPEQANSFVTEGINGIPLSEAEQAYYYAGANGVSALEAAKTLSDLDVDSERAIKAWQIGAENKSKYTRKETSNAPTVTTKYARDISKAINETAVATVNPITRKVNPFEVKAKETPAKTEKDKKRFYPEYTSYSSLDEPTISLGDEKYSKFRTNKPLTELGEDLVGIYAITGEIPETVLNKYAESVWNGTTLEKAEFTEKDSKAYDFIREQESDNSLFLEYEDSWWGKLNELNPERFSNDIKKSERQKVVEDFFHLYERAEEEQKVSDFYKNISELKEEIIRLTKEDYDGIKAYVGNDEYFYKPRTEEGKSDLAKLEDFAHKDRTETTAVKNPVRSIVKENYNEAAEKFRTEENAEMFDVAYNQGLLGEKLNLGVIVPDKDISAVSQAYVAGTRDARIIAERRANFNNRTPGLFTDAVTEQLSKKIGSRTLNAIDALGKKLGVQIHFIQRGEAGHEKYSYYSPSDGVIAINVNEIHGKLTGDKLVRFIANHEGIHRIRETSPKAYAEMERIALSKSKQTVEDRMARFGESKERATEEIVADYFGEVLTSNAEIKSLLNKNRTVFDAIMEALEWLVDKMRGIANYSFSEIAEARKLFQEALKEADANVWDAEVRGDGEVWSRSEESEYLELAKNPKKNEARLREMVDKAAKAAGYTEDAYHGTNQGDFTVFDWDKTQRADGGFFGRGHYFTKSKSMAGMYGKRIVNAKLKLGKTFVWSEMVNSYQGKKAPELLSRNIVSRINMAKVFPDIFANKTMSYWEYDTQKNENVEKTIKWGELEGIVNDLAKGLTLREYADGTFRWHTEGRFWEVPVGESYSSVKEANDGKFFAAINAIKEKYEGLLSSMTFDDQTTYTQRYGTEITEALKKDGYNSAMDTPEGGEIVVFNSNQVKSADLVTYDENGNIIPLSERFNDKKSDIRWSRSDSEESKIVSLKHNKNVYSLFKGAKRIISNKEYITDGYVAIPFSEKNFEKVKSVGKKANIGTGYPLPTEQIYGVNNDVVIQGEPKIGPTELPSYIFNIDGMYYAAQQKYIDTFNNGKNTIKANEKYTMPWTVLDEKGNFVAAFMPMFIKDMTDEKYARLKSVSEVKQEKVEKAEIYNDKDLSTRSDSDESADNVKYFPPGEDPRREIKVPSEVNGKKVRRFTRTAAESPALTPEMAEDVVSEIENGRFYYTPSSNKALADNAMNKVDNDVIQAASEWKTAFDSGKMITDKDIAIGEALIIEAGKRGDTERAIELISEIAIVATEAGKSVQAIKLLKRMTPEGQVYYLSKVVERLNKERGKTKGKEFDKSIEAENKATEADKKYKQAEAKVKTAEKKLFDIETAIEEYTKDLDIEVKIAESVKKVADLKKKLSEAKGKVKSADASSEKLGDNIKEIEGQLEEERKKLKEAMTKRDAILKERAEKGLMLSKLKAGVKRVDNATDHVLGEIDILEDDISKIEEEYDKAVKFRDECAEERRRLIKERNFLIKDTEAADKASERYSKEISQLEEQISELSDKYLVAKSAAERASLIRKELKAERNGLSYKLAKIENAIDWENENRETEIAKLKEEIAQLLNAEYEASKELEKAKEERTLKQKAKDKARKLSSAAKMGANIIELPADIKKAILESKTEEELNENVELAKDYIAENMVATKAERIKAWRYLSMLGNTLTQFRNITSNLIMLLNVLQKNVVAIPIETVVVYASHKNLEKKLAKMKADGATEAELKAYRDEHYAERTKTITLFKKKSAELKKFVTESWESNIKLAKGQSGKNDNIIGDINDRRTIFKSEKPVLKQVAAGVEAWRKATNWAMELGDEVFLRINYKHALTSYILSNKWDVATMTETQKMRAEQYALKEAQEATFRDESVIADWINKGRNKGWAAELAIGGLMPFTKTPINITKRSIEYGPTGIVNSIVQGVKASKGQATSADVVNALAKTLSGSALAGLGFYLAAKGLLRSKGDKEDEEYNYLIGEQDYSLIIGDYRFSLEWAAPAVIPLLFGAAIYNACFDKDGGIKEEYMVDENGNLVLNTRAMAMHKVMNATSAMFAPIFEASYLSGLTDSFSAAWKFGGGDASEGLAILGINAGLSYANQFIPTVFGQIARTIDPAERRNNDYDKTSILPYSVQRGIEKSKNKIPFLNRTSTPYVNAWGEEEIKQGALDYILSGAENIILPGYIEEVTDDELTDELWRLEKTEAAEEKKVFPESVKTSYTEDGKTIPLTAEQRNERQKVAGQKGREYIEAFYIADEYGKLTDAERVKAIDLLWAKANEEGIQAVRPDYVSKDSNVIKMNITEKNVGISPVDYTLWKIAYEKADEDENGSYNTDEVNAALDIFIELSGKEWTDEQLGYLWETRAPALSKSNPYGRALLGTPWYQRKKEEGNTWMRERE